MKIPLRGRKTTEPRRARSITEKKTKLRQSPCSRLRKAIAAGLVEVPFVSKNPMFENIRSDRQFQQLIAEMQAKVDAMRRNAGRRL